MEWACLHNHTMWSLLDCVSKPKDIASRAKELGLKAIASTDHGNISSNIQMEIACKKEGIKYIRGCEFYVCKHDIKLKDSSNRFYSHLVVLAKNKQGFANLIKAVSHSNNPDVFYYKPRLDLTTLAQFADKQWIIISGHPGSTIADDLFVDKRKAYNANTYEVAKSYVRKDWIEHLKSTVGLYQDLFGKENFFLEVQLIDEVNLPATQVLAQAYRYIAKKISVSLVATADPHYVLKDDASNQRIILANSLKTTLNEIQNKLNNEEDVGLGSFFKSNQYYIPSPEEIGKVNTPEEMKASLTIAEACEEYSVRGSPKIPGFTCPLGTNPKDYIRKLCEDGFDKRILNYVKPDRVSEYVNRLQYELNTFNDVENLSGGNISLNSYFLIDWDICQWVLNQGWLIGPGRGSAAGCLTSYLLGITNIDPIEADLSFERFYNAGRNSPGRISLPDIDIDVQKSKRDHVIDYIKNKYGTDKVAQMATFGRLQGRKAVGEVLRAYGKPFDERNEICKHIPGEAEIADDLQEMREERGKSSIIQWALENNKELHKWCSVENGEYVGEYAFFFKQAVKLEGVKNQQGRHASGLVISPLPLAEISPMMYDRKSKQTVVGYELADAEEAGLPKWDFLGLNTLDKFYGVSQLLRTGEIDEN